MLCLRFELRSVYDGGCSRIHWAMTDLKKIFILKELKSKQILYLILFLDMIFKISRRRRRIVIFDSFKTRFTQFRIVIVLVIRPDPINGFGLLELDSN